MNYEKDGVIPSDGNKYKYRKETYQNVEKDGVFLSDIMRTEIF